MQLATWQQATIYPYGDRRLLMLETLEAMHMLALKCLQGFVRDYVYRYMLFCCCCCARAI